MIKKKVEAIVKQKERMSNHLQKKINKKTVKGENNEKTFGL